MAADGNSVSYRIALIAAASALLGSVLGATITGYVSLRAQRIAADQAERAAIAQASRELGADYVDSAADFYVELAHFAETDWRGHPDEEARFERFERTTAELCLKSSTATAGKVLAAFAYVSELSRTDRRSSRYRELASNGQPAIDAFAAVYIDAEKYRLQASPTALRDEMLTTFLQSLGTSSTATP